MMQGTVIGDEACIELTVSGPMQTSLRIVAVVDSGYTGHLTLRDQTISALQLTSAGHRHGILADGSIIIMPVFLATVEWHGRPRDIVISQTDGTPLVGMRMLHGSKLTMEVFDGGKVVIEELPGMP